MPVARIGRIVTVARIGRIVTVARTNIVGMPVAGEVVRMIAQPVRVVMGVAMISMICMICMICMISMISMRPAGPVVMATVNIMISVLMGCTRRSANSYAVAELAHGSLVTVVRSSVAHGKR
jgi:hypothetical protein